MAHGVPPRYTEAAWGQVQGDAHTETANLRAPDLLTAWLRRGLGLLLFGPPGTGKSSLAALVCSEVVSVGRPVRWEYVPAMVDELNQGKAQAQAVVRRTVAPALLVLDDFGVARLAEWEVGQLDKVVETRYRARKSTVVTTNLTKQALAGDPALARILDRWRQTNKGLVLGGRSRRTPETLDTETT